jgi:hypothetical protein
MSEEEVRTEEFRVSGEGLLRKFKEVINEGNARRLTIKNEDGKTLINIPLTLGVAGAVFAPQAAAIGAIAALVTDCTIIVEKLEKKEG